MIPILSKARARECHGEINNLGYMCEVEEEMVRSQITKRSQKAPVPVSCGAQDLGHIMHSLCGIIY